METSSDSEHLCVHVCAQVAKDHGPPSPYKLFGSHDIIHPLLAENMSAENVNFALWALYTSVTLEDVDQVGTFTVSQPTKSGQGDVLLHAVHLVGAWGNVHPHYYIATICTPTIVLMFTPALPRKHQ